jgi:lantibiotic modifying enzyme
MPPSDEHNAWRPVLDGPAADRALEVVRVIADSLGASERPRLGDGAAKSSASDASLAEGRAGLALLYHYLCRACSDEAAGGTALRLLDAAIDTVAQTKMGPSLYTGFVGVAWAGTHCCSEREDSEEDDSGRAVDEALREYLEWTPWQRDYDLVTGLVGLGVYALERLPRPRARECLERVVDRLDETAEPTPQGITWLTRPELLPPQQREACPQGYYNLGVAHGLAGVIAMLGRVCAEDVGRAKARPLLDGAVAWLLAQKLPGSPGAGFPSWVGPGIEAAPARSAWCYGDPGIAAALLYAARCVGESSWADEAIEIGRAVANRSPDETGVVDAYLCHGAAGLGHLYNRMFQATGEACFGDAARFWFERTLELLGTDPGTDGSSSETSDAQRQQTWLDNPGILTGAAGVALALLGATTPIEPAWDRMLLVAVPPASP